MIRKIPIKPKRIPKLFFPVIASPRKSLAKRAIRMGLIAIIHPVLIAVV